jgi:hypothetical protein
MRASSIEYPFVFVPPVNERQARLFRHGSAHGESGREYGPNKALRRNDGARNGDPSSSVDQANATQERQSMFEKIRIKEHMEVTTNDGRHIGTVDEVDGDNIKLTKSDSSDSMHHFVKLDEVDKIDDNRVYMKADATIPQGAGANTVTA